MHVEKLKRMVSVIFGEVTAKLDVTLTARGKGNVGGRVEIEDGGSVDDEGASDTHIEKLLKEMEQREREVRASLSEREILVS